MKSSKKVYSFSRITIIDSNGKRIQKACRQCKNRHGAKNYTRILPGGRADGKSYAPVLIKTIDLVTMKEARGIVTKIIEDFGDGSKATKPAFPSLLVIAGKPVF